MDYDKISFKFYVPQYDEYFERYANDRSITEYVSFSKSDCKLIFYDNDFVGFFKTFTRDEDVNDKEICIALIPKYRGKGLATHIITTLVNNISKRKCNV